MTGESSSEALDFVLKSLEKFQANFKRLISQLRGIGESQGLSVEETEKLKDVKVHLSAFQREISNTVNSLSGLPTTNSLVSVRGPPLIIRCKNWEDFKRHVLNADTISFLCQEEEKTFQVDAVKGGNVYTYSGEVPSGTALLRTWLSKEVDVEEDEVLEGLVAIG